MHRHKLKRGGVFPFVGTTLDDYYLWLNQVINRNRPALDRWELNEAFRSLGSLLNDAIASSDTHVLSTNLVAGVGATYLHNANGSYVAFLGGLRYLYTATDGTNVSSFDIRAGASSVSLSHGNSAGVTAAVLDLNATGTSYVGGSKVGEVLVSTNDVANTVLRYGSVLQLVQSGGSPPFNEYTPYSLPQTVVAGDIGKVLTVISATEIGMVTPTLSTGTTNTLSMFISANVLGDSVLTQSGTDINAAGNLGFGGNLVDTTNGKIIEMGVSDMFVQAKHLQAGYGIWARSTLLSSRAMGIDGTSSTMNMYTNGGIKMTIKSSGDVGIGTVTPTGVLEVKGSELTRPMLQLHNTNNTPSAAVLFLLKNAQNLLAGYSFTNSNYVTFNGAKADQLQMYGRHLALAATDSAGDIRMFTAGYPSTFGKERMRIDNAGNVGIGTTSPSTLLEVGGSGTTISATVGGRMRVGATGNEGGIWLGTASTMLFGQVDATTMGFYNTNWRIVVKNDGKIGMGTITPATELEVVGTITSTDLILTGLPVHADEAAAAALATDTVYMTATGELRIKL